MSYNNNYQKPAVSNGAQTPPPSAKPTMNMPSDNNNNSSSNNNNNYSPYDMSTSPISNPAQQMTVYHHGMQVNSPPQMNQPPASPYPQPSSQSTQNLDPMQWSQFLQWQQQQQQVQFQRPPQNMMPRNPQFVQQNVPQDSGYGSMAYETLGQAQGLPGRNPQAQPATHNMRPGHTYGNLQASGNARIIRGNVLDLRAPTALERRHDYGDAQAYERARIFDGNVTSEHMKGFWEN